MDKGGTTLGGMIDITGNRYGRLTVENTFYNKEKGKSYCTCKCDCGKTTVTRKDRLLSGRVKSCGCLHSEISSAIAKEHAEKYFSKDGHVTHGNSNTRLHRIWTGMKTRCYNSNSTKYKLYGGRGIMVCDEWKDDFQAFHDWSIANGYREGLSIDRIDVNGDYCPENCRWATAKEQQNNRANNIKLDFMGEERTLQEWANKTGIPAATIYARTEKLGWSIERALTEPTRNNKKEK